MTTPRSREITETSLSQDLLYMIRYYLGGRRGLLILAGLALTAGLVLNWSWLVAVGIAPILIAVLPCIAMCALGLCMSRAGGKSCSTAAGDRAVTTASDDGVPGVQAATLKALPSQGTDAPPRIEDGTLTMKPDPQPAKRSSSDA
jgi:hypothetical protein